jgi:putative SOS response-associated peptidase YedK
MCGRFTLTATPKAIAETFQVPELPGLEPRYNIAPTQPVPIIRNAEGASSRALVQVRWGLIPSWADDPSIGNRLINARAETAAEKPSFRAAFRHRRCLIPASGFYEWQKVGTKKQPHYIRPPDNAPFAFAGLWEHWEKGGGPIESCTILTTEANVLMRPIHDRMPVILGPEAWDRWLDPNEQQAAALKPLLRPCPDGWLTAYPVSTRVNNPKYDGPACIAPANP